MPQYLIDFLIPFVAITTSCVVALVGMKIFLNYRRDVRIGLHGGEHTKNLAEDVSRLHEEVLFLRDGLDEVSERLEFHERLLTKASREEANTPV